MTLRCRNQEKVIQEKDFSRRFTQLLKTANSKVAQSDQEPDSYHYSTDGETTIVEVDYDVDRKSTAAKGATVQFNSAKEAMSCTHVGFVLEGITTAISADRIEFNGAVEEPTFRKRVFK